MKVIITGREESPGYSVIPAIWISPASRPGRKPSDGSAASGLNGGKRLDLFRYSPVHSGSVESSRSREKRRGSPPHSQSGAACKSSRGPVKDVSGPASSYPGRRDRFHEWRPSPRSDDRFGW